MTGSAADTNPWRDAVIDALVVAEIYEMAHDADPRKALNDLLGHEQRFFATVQMRLLANALLKVLPPQVLHDVLAHCDPLTEFVNAITEERP